MRFMTMIRSAEGADPPQALVEAMGRHIEQGFTDRTLVEAGGLGPTALGAVVRLAGGSITVKDGPFAEAKEVVGGYAIIDVPSREDAIEEARAVLALHEQHWPQWQGEVEVRQIFG